MFETVQIPAFQIYLDSGSFTVPPKFSEINHKNIKGNYSNLRRSTDSLLSSIILGGVAEAAVEADPEFCSFKQHL